jgi:hypothetical protein
VSRRLRPTRRGWVVLATLASALLLAGAAATVRLVPQDPATADPSPTDAAAEPVAPRLAEREPDVWEAAVAAALPDDPWAWVADGADPLGALVERAPVVVLAAVGQPRDVARAAALAATLRTPLLLGEAGRDAVAIAARADDVTARLDAWETRLVVAVGEVDAPTGVDVRRWSGGDEPPSVVRALVEQAEDGAEAVDPAEPAVALLRPGDTPSTSLVATARALGIVVHTLDDPFVLDEEVRAAIAAAPSVHLVGRPDAWHDLEPDTLAWHLEVVRAGHELPGGGHRIFPDRRLVALYGHPEGPALGLLGEQDVQAAIERAREHVDGYAELSDVPVVPAFEIIATIASAGAERTGDYSRRTSIETLRPWVDAAGEAGLFVVLDLQSGRTDFLTQAREYEELLREPHVGLALDPEWRLRPDQVHLRQIGSVAIDEVNEVAAWLAGLTREHALPQKLFVLHQFKLSMITDRARLDTSHPELATVIHVDGQGGQAAKDATYRALTTLDPPEGVWWGWKNFYDEDIPGLRSPEDTLAVEPAPVLITFQ